MSIRDQPEFVPAGMEFVPSEVLSTPSTPSQEDHEFPPLEDDGDLPQTNGELQIMEDQPKGGLNGGLNGMGSVETIPFYPTREEPVKPSRWRNVFPAMFGDHYSVLNTKPVDTSSRLRSSRMDLFSASQMALSASSFSLERNLSPEVRSTTLTYWLSIAYLSHTWMWSPWPLTLVPNFDCTKQQQSPWFVIVAASRVVIMFSHYDAAIATSHNASLPTEYSAFLPLWLHISMQYQYYSILIYSS